MSSATVLFDAPGPKAKLRHNILTVIGIAILVGIGYVVYQRFDAAGQLEAYMWEPFVTDSSVWSDYLIPGILGTLKAAAASIVLAVIFGIIFGMGRLSSIAPIRWVCSVIVEFFRSVPVLLMMVFAYFGIFANASFIDSEYAPFAAVVLSLTLYNGSVIAELIRSGVHGLPKGQREAGVAIGMTDSQVLRSILLPQALTAMLPTLISQLVVVLKDTALGYGITYLELLNWSKTLGSSFANTVPAYIVAALIFIVLNYTLSWVASLLEKKLSSRTAD